MWGRRKSQQHHGLSHELKAQSDQDDHEVTCLINMSVSLIIVRAESGVKIVERGCQSCSSNHQKIKKATHFWSVLIWTLRVVAAHGPIDSPTAVQPSPSIPLKSRQRHESERSFAVEPPWLSLVLLRSTGDWSQHCFDETSLLLQPFHLLLYHFE